jgi:hypothetical protein
VEDQKSEKLMQEYMALQEIVRLQFQSKQKQSLKMIDLAQAITYGQSRFKNNQTVMSMIVKLAEMVPEFISVKQLLIQGQKTRFVKYGSKKMTSVEVGAILKQKLV